MTRFGLIAEVSSDNVPAVQPVLLHMIDEAAMIGAAGGLYVRSAMDGADARDVNRRLLSALRQVERKTRLRAEWTAEGYVQRFFDYVPKSTRPVA